MIKKLLPLVLLLIGIGAGVGAGIFLRPDPPVDNEQTLKKVEDESPVEEVDAAPSKTEFVKFSNQFVVPIVDGNKVAGLVVLALSLEVPAGKSDAAMLREPKLRDSFLRILFDHANIGGFDGNFTDADLLNRLRDALREVAQKDLGKDLVSDVLIVEIAKQDY